MSVPADYLERTYAGVLGKIIGVYLGRPFEQWSHERIMAELGEITYYVHERMGMPLVVTDDDISGTFTFVRALPDYGNPRDLTWRHVWRSARRASATMVRRSTPRRWSP
jgi:ADP-ribosylglycohydrolase